jgi:hypothetical protein
VQALSIAGYDHDRIAKYVGVAPKTLRKYYVRELETARMGLMALAASALASALKKQEAWAVCFTLKTIGNKLGWSERHEVTGADGGPIDHRIANAQAALESKLARLGHAEEEHTTQ